MSLRRPRSVLAAAALGLLILLTLCGSEPEPVTVPLTSADDWLIEPAVFGEDGSGLSSTPFLIQARAASSCSTIPRKRGTLY